MRIRKDSALPRSSDTEMTLVESSARNSPRWINFQNPLPRKKTLSNCRTFWPKKNLGETDSTSDRFNDDENSAKKSAELFGHVRYAFFTKKTQEKKTHDGPLRKSVEIGFVFGQNTTWNEMRNMKRHMECWKWNEMNEVKTKWTKYSYCFELFYFELLIILLD